MCLSSFSICSLFRKKYSSFNSHKEYIPKLRFKGFTDSWSTATLGDLGTFIKGAPLSKADISAEGTPFILYGELYTTYKEVAYKIMRKTQRTADNECLSCIGDVIIPTSGETPEEIATATCVMLPDVILAGDLNIYRNNTVDGRIISYIINHVVNADISRIAQGKSVVHIKAEELAKIQIHYPTKSEQSKLLNFLHLLDNKIEKQQLLVERIKSYKRGLLRHVFNHINGDWKEYKLSDIAKIYQPQTIASTDLIKDGTYHVYGANGCIGRYNRYNHDTEQIAICCRGASCGTVNFIPAFSWITGNAMVVNIQSSIADKVFVYYCLLATDLSYMISGSGQPQIVREPCANHKIYLPNIHTQQHIAELFSTLDKNIDRYTQILQKLETTKQALLQNLFI